MRHFVALASIIAAARAGLIMFGNRPDAVAEESALTAMADHPVVGA